MKERETMRKLVLFMFLFFLLGCSEMSQNMINDDVNPNQLPSITDSSATLLEDNSEELDPVPEGYKVYYPHSSENKLFSLLGKCPSYLEIFREGMSIAYGYEGGFPVDPKDNPNFQIYTGMLTQIAENVYSSKGVFHYLEYDGEYDDYVASGVDFYIILRGRKLYAVFEEKTVEELMDYQSDDYFELFDDY